MGREQKQADRSNANMIGFTTVARHVRVAIKGICNIEDSKRLSCRTSVKCRVGDYESSKQH